MSLEISLVLLVEAAEAVPVGPLGVGVYVHLDHAVADRLPDLLSGGAAAAVHHQVQGLGVVTADQLVGVLLVPPQQVGRQHHVAGLVHAVDIAEGGGYGEGGGDGGQGLVDVVHLTKCQNLSLMRITTLSHLLRLRVERVSLDPGVVHAVLLAPGDANLHLEPKPDRGHPLEILDAGRDVLLVELLAEVQHMTGEQRLAVRAEILLIRL